MWGVALWKLRFGIGSLHSGCICAGAEILGRVPEWRDDRNDNGHRIVHIISIHVPRVGDDTLGAPWNRVADHFNPRPPRGGRHAGSAVESGGRPFQSTSPAWGTTRWERRGIGWPTISIHVPRVGDDFLRPADGDQRGVFQSTSPAWGTTFSRDFGGNVGVFQSTSPAWGTTAKQHKNKTLLSYLGYPFHKILSNANPIFSEFLHSTAKDRHSAVRTCRQMGVHLGFAPANWRKARKRAGRRCVQLFESRDMRGQGNQPGGQASERPAST